MPSRCVVPQMIENKKCLCFCVIFVMSGLMLRSHGFRQMGDTLITARENKGMERSTIMLKTAVIKKEA